MRVLIEAALGGVLMLSWLIVPAVMMWR